MGSSVFVPLLPIPSACLLSAGVLFLLNQEQRSRCASRGVYSLWCLLSSKVAPPHRLVCCRLSAAGVSRAVAQPKPLKSLQEQQRGQSHCQCTGRGCLSSLRFGDKVHLETLLRFPVEITLAALRRSAVCAVTDDAAVADVAGA